MALTGTYAWNPAGGNLALSAFARIGIRRTEITAQHMTDADVEANLVQVELSNRVPNLWLDELHTQVLTAGTATYTLPQRLVAFQAPYISIDSGGTAIDRIIYCYSTWEFSSIPNKTTQGSPTVYWLNMQITPEITFWPVPDDSSTYTFKARMLRQVQDASLSNGLNIDFPYRWIDVFVAKLAHRLARIYARDLEQQRRADAEEAWTIAATTDKEQVPTYLNVNTNPYYA
jgi:hypothetical protein